MTHCNHIRQFSSAVYHFLTDVFNYRLSFSEIGITDHLVFNLVKYSRLTGQNNVEIFKVPWPVESVYGNDIDLFIQNSSGTFNWYALQAKVMSFNGAFKDLKYDGIAINQQWDKLLNHETTFGSKTYYLLYSGKSLRPPITQPTRSDCLGIPSIDELGLGIVETRTIQTIRTSILTQYGQFFFRHVFPNDIDSIRKLFCCSGSLPQTTKQFIRAEIDTSGYQKIYFNDNEKIEDIDEVVEKSNLKDGFAPIRLIVTNEDNASR